MSKTTRERDMAHLVALASRISETVQGEKLLNVMAASAMIMAYAIVDQYDVYEARLKAVEAMRIHILKMLEEHHANENA